MKPMGVLKPILWFHKHSRHSNFSQSAHHAAGVLLSFLLHSLHLCILNPPIDKQSHKTDNSVNYIETKEDSQPSNNSHELKTQAHYNPFI
jgi:hypothetical protein